MRLLLALFALILSASAHASLPLLTFFTGTLQGETRVAGFPAVKWTLISENMLNGHQSATFLVNGSGLILRVKLQAGLRAQTLAWEIEEGRLPLGPWFEAVAPRLPEMAHGLALTGELGITGSGTFENNQPVGTLILRCRDASVRHAIDGWTLDGIDFDGAFRLAPGFDLNSTSPAVLTVKTITTSRFGARNFSMTGSVVDSAQALISRARIEIAGGEVEAIDPFTVPFAPLAIDAQLSIRRVGLQDFVALVPSGLSSARGKLNGDLRITWSAEKEFQIGKGLLALDEVEPTVIRLAASPGFLTGSMPERIQPWKGFLGRLFSFRNPSVKDLRDIELGVSELEVNSLRVHLTPDGDSRGRTAHVEVDARPLQPGSVVKRVTFDVNVQGPFSSLLRLGLNQPFSVELR